MQPGNQHPGRPGDPRNYPGQPPHYNGMGGMGGANAVPFQPGMPYQTPPGMMGGGMPPMPNHAMGGPNAMPFQPGMPYGAGMGGPSPYGNGGPDPYGNTEPMPNMPYGGYGRQPMDPYMQQQHMMPQQPQHGQPLPPPTDEEQAWLEQQMMQAEAGSNPSAPERGASAGPIEEQIPDEPPTPTSASQPAEAAAGDFDDVMKLIEENRRKNEAKRAAQSARNAEIIAAFEQRQSAGS